VVRRGDQGKEEEKKQTENASLFKTPVLQVSTPFILDT